MALQDFNTAVQDFGFGKKYSFQVTDLQGPPSLVSFNAKQWLYVESLTIPSRKTNTTKVPYKAFDFVVPTNTSFPENESWKVNFFSDEKLKIRRLFDTWSEATYKFTNNYGGGNLGFGNCNLEITINDDKGSTKKAFTLYGVYPVLIGSMEYNVSDAGTTVAKVPVTLAFQYFDSKY